MNKAWVISKFGGVNVFKEQQVKKQSIRDGCVRIETAAVGINSLDLRIRQGLLPYVVDKFPLIMHGDVSGVITEIGDGVLDLRVGDEVYGFIGGVAGFPGGLQKEVVVPAQLLAKRPRTLSLEESAALPFCLILAYLLVFEYTQIRPGQTVMVYNGVSGVGHIATQLAKHMKTKVITTVETKKEEEEAQEYLADGIVNTKKISLESYLKTYTGGEGFSVIIDPIGDEHLSTSMEAAALFGTIATNNTKTTCDLSLMNEKSLNLHVVNVVRPMMIEAIGKHYQEILTDSALMIDRGEIKLRLDKSVFYYKDVAKAHAYVESGKSMGNVILRAK